MSIGLSVTSVAISQAVWLEGRGPEGERNSDDPMLVLDGVLIGATFDRLYVQGSLE
jgi:hypothetical protein